MYKVYLSDHPFGVEARTRQSIGLPTAPPGSGQAARSPSPPRSSSPGPAGRAVVNSVDCRVRAFTPGTPWWEGREDVIYGQSPARADSPVNHQRSAVDDLSVVFFGTILDFFFEIREPKICNSELRTPPLKYALTTLFKKCVCTHFPES